MDFTGRNREFTPQTRFISLAHKRWAHWCQERAGGPAEFRRFLERSGMHVDPKTAASWWRGESLPSTARIIQLKAMGKRGIFEAIFEPALLAGDLNKRKQRIAEMRAELEREEDALRETSGRALGLRNRAAGQSFDVDGPQDQAGRARDNGLDMSDDL